MMIVIAIVVVTIAVGAVHEVTTTIDIDPAVTVPHEVEMTTVAAAEGPVDTMIIVGNQKTWQEVVLMGILGLGLHAFCAAIPIFCVRICGWYLFWCYLS
mmetsp:Transcript_14518/g.39595  ORF Transcript_14518/g.39595 Transcript_14518/m.39595 type:complete len:99 (+) Transcript_14518:784-1080(+)